ncbi:MAG: hypothetical protein K1V82_00825 [Alistipes sp.]
MKTAQNVDERVCVNRGKRTDAQYIAALERSNKTLSSENRRLIRERQAIFRVLKIR